MIYVCCMLRCDVVIGVLRFLGMDSTVLYRMVYGIIVYPWIRKVILIKMLYYYILNRIYLFSVKLTTFGNT